MLDEFEMALSQSEKLVGKRKAETKCYKRIMVDAERHDGRSKKQWKHYAVAKQKEKGEKPSKKVIEAQQFKCRTQKQNQKAKKQPKSTANLNSASTFSIWVPEIR